MLIVLDRDEGESLIRSCYRPALIHVACHIHMLPAHPSLLVKGRPKGTLQATTPLECDDIVVSFVILEKHSYLILHASKRKSNDAEKDQKRNEGTVC